MEKLYSKLLPNYLFYSGIQKLNQLILNAAYHHNEANLKVIKQNTCFTKNSLQFK